MALSQLRCGVLLVVLLSLCAVACAADGWLELKPKAGEEVEVLHLGKWIPATVLQVDKRQAQVEFTFVSRARQEVVPFDKLRYPWQATAISPARVWRDASGSFSVRAAVMKVDRKVGQVTLFRIDESNEVTIPIAKLSEPDQKRIEALAQAGPRRTTDLVPLEQFAPPDNSFSPWSEAQTLAALSPDPPAVAVGVPMGGVAFPKVARGEELVGLLPIGSSAGWMVAGTVSGSADASKSRLLWVTLADGKVKKEHPLPGGERLVAIDPASSQVLTISKDESRDWALTVWNASPKSDTAEPRVRWASQSDAFTNHWADFVSPQRIIHQRNRRSYVVWDFSNKAAVYSIDQESFFHAQPVLSPGRRYLALPEDKGVRILSAADGKTLASLPISGGSSCGVAFDAKGEKLAVLTGQKLAVWTLGSAEPPREMRADLLSGGFAKSLAWVDERTLLVDGRVLYDLELKLPVWNYTLKTFEVKTDRSGSKTISVVGGKFCYSVEVRGPSRVDYIVVGAVELPGPQVRQTVAKIDPESLYVIKPGGSVRIETRCGEFDSRVRAALEAKVLENGWHLDDQAPFTLEAEMGRSEQQTVTYQHRQTGAQYTVSVQPHFSNLRIRQGETLLWRTGTSTGLASVLFVRDNESPQQQANELQIPQPGFFDTVKIPEKIFDERFARGFGTSQISSRGIDATPMVDLPQPSTVADGP